MQRCQRQIDTTNGFYSAWNAKCDSHISNALWRPPTLGISTQIKIKAIETNSQEGDRQKEKKNKQTHNNEFCVSTKFSVCLVGTHFKSYSTVTSCWQHSFSVWISLKSVNRCDGVGGRAIVSEFLCWRSSCVIMCVSWATATRMTATDRRFKHENGVVESRHVLMLLASVETVGKSVGHLVSFDPRSRLCGTAPTFQNLPKWVCSMNVPDNEMPRSFVPFVRRNAFRTLQTHRTAHTLFYDFES